MFCQGNSCISRSLQCCPSFPNVFYSPDMFYCFFVLFTRPDISFFFSLSYLLVGSNFVKEYTLQITSNIKDKLTKYCFPRTGALGLVISSLSVLCRDFLGRFCRGTSYISRSLQLFPSFPKVSYTLDMFYWCFFVFTSS